MGRRRLVEKLLENSLEKLEKYGIWGLLILFSIAYSLIGTLRYNHFLSGGYDLAHYTQAIWQYSQGKLARVTIFGNIYILGDHFEPVLIFFAPIYRLFPDPRTIIIIQSIISVFAAYPVYLFSKGVIKNLYLSFIPVLIYLLNPNLQYALDYDFHTSTIMVLPLSFFYYAYLKNKKNLYWLSLILIFLTKEDGAVFTLFLGAYQLFFSKTKKQGLITILASLFWFYLVHFKLMPFFYGGERPATRFIDFYFLGKDINEIIKNSFLKPWLLIYHFFNHSEKLKTLILLFGSFSFLPLFSFFSLFNSLPFIAEKFYSSTNSRWLFNQYHQANILPLFVFGYVLTIKYLQKKRFGFLNFLLIVSLVVILAINRFFHLPITRLFHLRYYKETEKEKNIKAALKKIPENVSVSAQFPFTSYLANREKIYLFPEMENEVEYIVLTLNGLPTYPLSKEEIDTKIKNYKSFSRMKVFYEKDGTYFFQRLPIK